MKNIEFYTDRVSLKNMTDKEHLYFYDKAYRFDYKAGVDTSGAKYWNFVGKTLLWKSYKRINEKTYGNHTKASMKKNWLAKNLYVGPFTISWCPQVCLLPCPVLT